MVEGSQKAWHFVRLSMILCWVLWFVTFFIAMTLFQAVLHIQVVSQVVKNAERGFISFDEDFVQTVPLDVIPKERFAEMLTRYFLEVRYTRIPDMEEMERRWGPGGIVARLSTPNVYEKLHFDIESVEGKTSMIVDIKNISLERSSQSAFNVALDVYVFDGQSRWIKHARSLSVQFAHDPNRIVRQANFANPYGFVITEIDDRPSQEQ